MSQAVVARSAALDQLCINTIRTLAMDAVEAADSGHPGAPMGRAPLAYVLWTRHLRPHPRNPAWFGRDRFVLSCGHASMLLYGVLHLTGYDLPLDELKRFRQWGSKTPGHPEFGVTPGVETTTGPLGQGFGNAVGMALARAHLAALFNRPGHEIITHRVYFLASDGDLMEGVSHEAASLAGHLGLGALVGFYDDNRVTIDGSTDLTYSDDVLGRFAAYGWHVQRVDDGNDLLAIDRAIDAAKAEQGKPSLISVRTHIAYGSPNKQDTAAAHGAPLGEAEVRLTKKNLGWEYEEPFTVPADALAEWRRAVERGAGLEREWEDAFGRYREAHPELAGELERRLRRELPADWDADLPSFEDEGAMATRTASGRVLNAIARRVPELLGGSADLGGSNNTLIEGVEDLGRDAPGGRNMYFGVREHGMGAVLNGMALHGGLIPYGGTFLIFSDYMRPSIRLAALMGIKVIYVFTHDSIGLGEDGPTHQPVEQLAGLRAIPNLTVIRPADAPETVQAWRVALEHDGGPVAMVLTRQKVPSVDRGSGGGAEGLRRGGYVLREASKGTPDLILMASGSEVHPVLEARELLESEGIRTRVVSMPAPDVFALQSAGYRDQVLPPTVSARLAVEAAHPMPWYRWVGDRGAVLGITRFGASAPYQTLFREYGFSPAAIAARARTLLAR
ncbi:MAG: transketolase [Gemmatimonadales bacterium]